MSETLANGYSSDSTLQELSNEYHHDLFYIIFINICLLVHLDASSLSIGMVKAENDLISEATKPYSMSISYCLKIKFLPCTKGFKVSFSINQEDHLHIMSLGSLDSFVYHRTH